MVYIGPPDISPDSLTSRYFTASIHSLNLDVMPKRAESHIQTKAPGPPDTMAVATPTIFPVPMVAARAVVRAEKDEISPGPLPDCLASFPRLVFSAKKRLRGPRNRVRMDRNRPVPISKTSITGPHTRLSIWDMMDCNGSIGSSSFMKRYGIQDKKM